MKLVKYVNQIVILLLFLLLGACSTASDPAESYKNETAQAIFKRGEDALRDRSYQEAIKRFEDNYIRF